jgi:cyclopropane-fatty-acyl-phospholipid synthase
MTIQLSRMTPKTPVHSRPRLTQRPGLSRRLVLAQLARLGSGRLVLSDAHGVHTFGPDDDGPEAHVHVSDPLMYSHVLKRGLLGAGEAYAEGAWSSPDLVAVIQLFLRNRDMIERMEGGWSRLITWPLRTAMRLLPNNRRRARKHIAAHYDLGNEFFALFLDPSMTYSSALFERPDSSLEEAQTAKYDRLCQKLRLDASHHVLEIGSGWGGFAIHAARTYGCRVTTTTISPSQYALATERIEAAGLSDRITLLLQDYRDLEGTFDRVVSIEMIEAVGRSHLDHYLEVCGARLKEDGLFGLQAITITDAAYERASKRVDFIKRHIFPGTFIPSVTAILGASTANSDMRLLHLEDIGLDYAKTLQTWRERLATRRPAARLLGFDDTFLRAWDYYFGYCEGGFRSRFLGAAQMVFANPACQVVTPARPGDRSVRVYSERAQDTRAHQPF